MSFPRDVLRCIFVFLILTGWGGCTEQTYKSVPEDDDTCLVRVQIQTTGSSTRGTRAEGYPDTYIETIDVLSFREDNSTFQYRSLASVIDLSNQWFDVVMNKSQDEKQVLVIIANLRQELDALALSPGVTTLEDLRNTLSFEFIQQTTYDATHDPAHVPEGIFGADRPLPMWGESEPVVMLQEQMTIGTIYLLRSLASVTVLINLDPTDTDQKSFELVDVVITRTPDKGWAIPDPDLITVASDGSVTATGPTAATLGATFRNAYYSSADGVTITDGIYIGEYSNTTAGMVDDDRTWLLVGGIYDNSGDVTWYRLPFIDRDGKQWDILRNHNYIFNITKVTGPGNTEEDAKDAEIYTDVIPWNLGTQAAFDIEGIYWIWIDPNAATYDEQGGNGIIHIETNYPSGWTATVSGSETDMTVPCTWMTITSTIASQLDYTVDPNMNWELRTGYLHIWAAGFAVTIRIEQTHLYVTGYSVTPAGDIPSDGQTRAVTLVGLFDDVPLRVMDVTNNTELVQSPAVSVPGNVGTSNPNSSASVTIPAWTSDVTRTVAIQYFDPGLNSWITVQEAQQEGYNFTVASTLTNGSTIANANQSYNINISGTSWPDLYARAVIQGTSVVVAGPVTINAGTGSGTSAAITIDTYEQWNEASLNRLVELQWSRDQTNWTSLNYGTQPGAYSVTGTELEIPPIWQEYGTLSLIPLLGATLQAKVEGSYASGWIQIQVVASGTSTQVSTDTPTITDVSTRTVGVTVDRNPNYTGASTTKYPGLSNYAGHREVQCQYRRYINSTTGGTGAWESTWTDMGPEVEQLGYVTLQTTGRVVAGQDYTDASGEVGFDWVTAMGISQDYNTLDYPEAGVLENTTNNVNWNSNMYRARTGTLAYATAYSAANGGCAAYTEAGTTYSFYLPTYDEIAEMGERFGELGQIAYESPWYYWMNEEFNHTNASGSAANVVKELRGITYDLEYHTMSAPLKTNLNRIRCVRAR